MQEKCRILLVEDHPLMRKGIRGMISDSDDFEVVGEAGAVKEAREILKTVSPDMVLMDISLPDGTGFDLIRDIKAWHPAARIVLLTIHREEPYLVKAIQDGAWGFVLKDMAPERLIETLRMVRNGEKCFYSASATGAGEETPEQAAISAVTNPGPSAALSNREEFVMRALAKGESLTEIATQLKISVKTVFTYRVRILQKLKLQTNSDIVRYAIERGIQL